MKSKLLQIKGNIIEQLQKLDEVINSIPDEIIKPIEPVEPEKPIEEKLDFRVTKQESRIVSGNRWFVVTAEWNKDFTGDMDISYYENAIPNLVFSVREQGHAINIKDGRHVIWVGRPGAWTFRAIIDGEEAGTAEVIFPHEIPIIEPEKPVEPEKPIIEPEKPIIEPEKPIVEPEKPIKPIEFFHGWWDSHWADNSGMSIIKVDSIHLDNHPRSVKKIVMLSGFKKDMTNAQIRSRIRGRINMYDRDDISMIILHDEPYYGGLSPDQVQYIADEAKKAYRHPVAMTFARGEINNMDRPIPHSLDACSINFYPFYVEGYNHWINDEATFNAHLQGSLNRIKKKGFTGGVFLVGQMFHDSPDNRKTPKYRKLPIEAIDWYFNAVEKHKLAGILWFEWRNRQNWVGANTMPEHRSYLKKYAGN